MGQTVYIKQMDGLRLPGTFGQIHNGCVRVDDICERCEGTDAKNHFDLFVGTAAYSKKMDVEMKTTDRMVTFQAKQCKVFTHKVSPSLQANQFLHE